VIGTGSGDPQKFDPDATRETLDHSLMYIFAAALFTAFWHHEKSYAPELTHEPRLIALWKKICTQEDPEWTRRYHSSDPREKAFGGRVSITLNDGKQLSETIPVPDGHPLGARPLARAGYLQKFRALTAGLLTPQQESDFLTCAERLAGLRPAELCGLNIALPAEKLTCATRDRVGIF